MKVWHILKICLFSLNDRVGQPFTNTSMMVFSFADFMEPYRPRPETTAAVARSLVTGALGLKPKVSKEQREEERQKIKEAKGNSSVICKAVE